MFDPAVWAKVPFEFWALVFFTFGCLVGSFLNVVIYRMPLGLSVVSPPSHCPKCKYSIPWFLNIPLVTWLALRGRCKNCAAPISVRYFLVELLTGFAFLACWLAFGKQSAGVALVGCLVLAGLIAATFIDFEHFIIPDEITIGGIVVGFICSFFFPALHGQSTAVAALGQSFFGILVGGGTLYAILRAGKLFFGRQKIELAPGSRVVFTENSVLLPDREMPYDEFFYRKSDTICLEAKTVELVDRCYANATVRLSQDKLMIGEDVFNPEDTHHMEVVTDQIVVPREAMGFGDVKFMAAIGAFLGWQATLFSLMASSVIGAAVGVTLIAMKRQEWSSRLPYGPYIALAAVIWMFAGLQIKGWIFRR